jgi:hypothetical protein
LVNLTHIPYHRKQNILYAVCCVMQDKLNRMFWTCVEGVEELR